MGHIYTSTITKQSRETHPTSLGAGFFIFRLKPKIVSTGEQIKQMIKKLESDII